MAKKNPIDPDQLKESFLSVAQKILEQEGRSALNARHLAQRVGYSVGTLYNVFKNMEDLIFHINANTMEGLKVFLLSAIEKANSPKQLAKVIGSSYLEYARRNVHVWNLLFEYQVDRDENLPYWYQQKVKEVFHVVEGALEDLLSHLSMDRRKIRRATRTLWAGLHGICLLELNGKLATTGGESPILLWDSLFQNYLTGMQLSSEQKRKLVQEGLS